MTTAWQKALDRAYKETGTERPKPSVPEPPLPPLPEWPGGWIAQKPTVEEEATLRAHGYRYSMIVGRSGGGAYARDRWPDAPSEGDAFCIYRSTQHKKTYVEHTSVAVARGLYISPTDTLYIWWKP